MLRTALGVCLAPAFVACAAGGGPPALTGPPCAALAHDPAPAGEFWYRQVRFASGRLTIGALLSRPPGAGPFPAYIHNHGSMTPERAAGPLWSLPDELDFNLVRAGFVVLRPARRGYLGSGGRTTTYLATGSKASAREVVSSAYDEADDVRAAFDYVKACPFVDPARIAIGGHSVGGLVTIIAAARLPAARAVASINGGISWRERGEQTGTSTVLAVFGREAGKIGAPVLLLHGAEDRLVDPDLSRRLAELLRRVGTPVELTLYPGDHYRFPIPELVRFLDRRLNEAR